LHRGENSNSMSLVSHNVGYASSNIFEQKYFSKNNGYRTWWYYLFFVQMHIMFLEISALIDQPIIFLLTIPTKVFLNLDQIFV
jgi:hypothetical protein